MTVAIISLALAGVVVLCWVGLVALSRAFRDADHWQEEDER